MGGGTAAVAPPAPLAKVPSEDPFMVVRVRLFATLADLAGRREIDLTVPERETAAALLARIEETIPALRGKLSGVAVAARAEVVGAGHVLADGEEIALLPPVSGG